MKKENNICQYISKKTNAKHNSKWDRTIFHLQESEVAMDIIRRIKKHFIAGLMMLALLVTGCGYLEPPGPQDFKGYGDDPIFNEDSKHKSFYQLFGDISSNEVKDLVQDMLNSLSAAARYGDITREDSEVIVEIIHNLRDKIANLDPADVDDESKLAKILQLMYENKVGDLLTSMVNAVGPNVLVENLYPVLEYLVNMDFGDTKGIPLEFSGSVPIEISDEEIENLKNALNRLVDPDGPYKDVYAASKTLLDLARAKEKENATEDRLTVGDIKEKIDELMPLVKDMMAKVTESDSDFDIKPFITAISDLLDIQENNGELDLDSVSDVVVELWNNVKGDSDFDVKPILDAMIELYNEDKDMFDQDSDNLLYALGRLMSDVSRPGQDGWNWVNVDGMTDFERILYCLQDLLNPVIQDRDVLHDFLQDAIEGTALLEGADSFHGILQGLSTVNTDDMMDIDTAVYKYLFQNNIYGESRGEGVDVNISVTRAFLYLLAALYPLGSADIGNALDLIGIEPGQNGPLAVSKNTLLEWLMGLMVVGTYEYPDIALYDFIDGYPDPLEGIDWVYYEMNLTLQLVLKIFGQTITIPLATFQGLDGILGILLDNPVILGLAGLLAGSLVDPLPAMEQFIGGTGSKHTVGDKHKLFAIAAPLLKHYYDQGRVLDMVEMATYVNEINPSTYQTLAWGGPNATFRKGTSQATRLGHVLENIEGRYGYGLIYYGLRGDSADDDNHDGDILDPVLDIMVRILNKLDNTSYESGTLIDYIAAGDGDTGGDDGDGASAIDKLFELDEDGESIIDKIYNLLIENHDLLIRLTKPMGEVILAFNNDMNNKGLDEDIYDILASGELNTALKPMLRTVLMELGITDGELLDASETVLDEVLKSSETLMGDIEKLLPIFINLLENLPTSTEGMSDTLSSILDTFLKEMDIDSPFSLNLKILVCRAMNLFDEVYNPNGTITDDTPVFDALDILIGENGMYNLMPIPNFIHALLEEDKKTQILSFGKKAGSDLPAETNVNDVEMILSLRFMKALFTSYDGRDPIVLMMLKVMNLDMNWDNEDGTVMNVLLKDFSEVMGEFHLDPEGNPNVYKMMLDLLNMAADNFKSL